MIRFFPAVAATLLVCPMFACSTNSGDPSQSVSHNADDAEPAPQEPQTLPITQPNRDTDISAIQNDAFALGDVSIEGDTLLITVSYGGGAEAHDFALYWNGMTMRSYPGQINVMLKHNAHGDAGRGLPHPNATLRPKRPQPAARPPHLRPRRRRPPNRAIRRTINAFHFSYKESPRLMSVGFCIAEFSSVVFDFFNQYTIATASSTASTTWRTWKGFLR